MGNVTTTDKKKKPIDTKDIEQGILDQIFHEMAVRSPDDTISKDTFLKFFELPGVLGDRLFEVFDTKKTGVIDLEEFIAGYSIFAKGDASQKMEILFQLFDLDGKGGVTKDELKTVLLSIITPPQQVMGNNNTENILTTKNKAAILGSPLLGSPASSNYLTKIDESHNKMENINSVNNKNDNKNNDKIEKEKSFIDGIHDSSFVSYSKQDFDESPLNIDDVEKRVNLIVKEAFDTCDVDESGRLEGKEFRNWMKKKPEIVAACEELFVQMAWNGPFNLGGHEYNMIEAEEGIQRYDVFNNQFSIIKGFIECKKCFLRFINKSDEIPEDEDKTDANEKKESYEYVILSWVDNENFLFKFCPKCGNELSQPQSKKSVANLLNVQSSKKSIVGNLSALYYEGYLKLAAGKFKNLKTRFVVLSGKFLYVYKTKEKSFPVAVVFIQGYFVDSRKNPKYDNKYMISLQPPIGSTSKVMNLYCDSEKDCLKWKEILENAARTTSITKYYDLGKLLGKGSFAEVREAVNKETKTKHAVKIIEKKVIDGKQKEYIRIEMSVMKLVIHPNVMRLDAVFETKNQIYMVMPLYMGGDLYEYMKKNARHGLAEKDAKYVVWNVLHALKYLHGVGIVHRDLKPENLLLKEKNEPTDVVITDFGLSKFAAPHTAMKAACGTLSYVAPEVLRMEGYGKEVDLWSLGVITFLILRAKLPFHDQTKNRIIARILRQPVSLVDPHWKKISKEARDLIYKLLIKGPDKRITCENAIKHDWFNSIRDDIKKKMTESQKKLKEKQIKKNDANETETKTDDNNSNNNKNNKKDNNNNKISKGLQPDIHGQSVRNIKYYNGDNDSENDKVNPMSLLRQNSVNNRNMTWKDI